MPAIAAAVPLYIYGGIVFTSLTAYLAYLWSQGINLNPFIKGDDYNPDNLVSLEELGIATQNITEDKSWEGSYISQADTEYNQAIQGTSTTTIPDANLGKFDYVKSVVQPDANHLKAVKLKNSDQWTIATAQEKKVINNYIEHKNLELSNKIVKVAPDNFIKQKDKFYETKKSQPVSFVQHSGVDVKPNNKKYDINQGNVVTMQSPAEVTIKEKVPPMPPEIKTYKNVNGTSTLSKSKLSNKTNVGQYADAGKGDLSNKVNVGQYQSAAKKIVYTKDKKGQLAESTSPSNQYYDHKPPVGDGSGYISGDTNDTVVSSPTKRPYKDDEIDGPETFEPDFKQPKRRPPGENPLYNLEPYTYEFTLSALPADLYNSADFKTASTKNVIAKSSGLGKNKSDYVEGAEYPTLAPGSQLNKHFGSVTLKSIIGLNSKTSVSNTHALDFQIFEPFGSNLLDDLHDAAVSIGYTNYLRCPYLLTLKFKGYDDEGRPVSNLIGTYGHVTRYFPLKIINCDFNVTGGGTTYNFQAVPYNANTMIDNVKYTQSPMNLKGATVDDFMQDLEDQLNAQNSIKEHNAKYPGSQKKYILLIDDMINPSESKNLSKSTINHDYMTAQSTSYAPELTEEGKKYFNGLNEVGTAGITAETVENEYGISDFTRRVYTFATGTSILSIIEAIVDSSDYVTRQVESGYVFTTGINSDGQVPWYNVDYKHLTYSRQYGDAETWVFKLFAHYVDSNTVLSVSKPGWVNTKPVARKYDYIYTGKNRDILNFDIQYNFAFFQAMAANRDTTTGSTSDKAVKSGDKSKLVETKPLIDAADGGLVPVESQATDTTMQDDTQGTEDANVTGRKKISNAKKAITNPEADLINLEIEILGDPYYLQQADFSPFNLVESTVNAQTYEDGSMNNLAGEVYINVNFKTPVDYDDESGLFEGLNLGPGKYNTAFFGGIYRVIQVESTFDGGQFIQRVTGVRLKNQQLDQPKAIEKEVTATTSIEPDTSAGETEGGATVTQGIDVQKSNEKGEVVAKNEKTEELLQNGSMNDHNAAIEAQMLKDHTDHWEATTYTGLTKDASQSGNKMTGHVFTGETVGPAGADQFTQTSGSTTETKTTGNKTHTTKKENKGNTTTITTSETQESGGEVTVTKSDEKKIGNAKYGGLTKKEYYEGKTLTPIDQATGREMVNVSKGTMITRNVMRIREEGEEQGLSKKEIRAKEKEYKVSTGLYEMKTTSSGREIVSHKGDWSASSITREYR